MGIVEVSWSIGYMTLMVAVFTDLSRNLSLWYKAVSMYSNTWEEENEQYQLEHAMKDSKKETPFPLVDTENLLFSKIIDRNLGFISLFFCFGTTPGQYLGGWGHAI